MSAAEGAELDAAAEASPTPSSPPPARPPNPLPKASLPARLANLAFGPVFDKQLRIAGRKRGGFVLRAIYAAFTLIITSLVFVSAWTQSDYGSAADRIAATQSVAPILASTVATLQFAAVLIIAPGLTAGVIIEERRRKTLSALLTTPLSATQIVFNKVAASGVQLGVLVLMSLPVLLGVRVYGGLPLGSLLAAAGVTLSAAVLGLACGIHTSCASGRARSGTLSAYGLLIGFLVLPPIGMYLLFMVQMATGGGVPARAEELFFLISPIAALTASIQVASGFVTLDQYIWSILGNMGVTLGVALLLMLHAVFRLRKLLRKEGEGTLADITRKQKKRRRARGRKRGTPTAAAVNTPDGVESPAHAEDDRGASREVTREPVLWRELASPLMSSRIKLVLTLLGGLLILGIVYTATAYTDYGWSKTLNSPFDSEFQHGMLAAIVSVLMLVQAAISTTGGITSEREAQTWDVLLTTRVSPVQIMRGKLLGALRRQWLLPMFFLTHAAVVLVGGLVTGDRWLHPAVIPLTLLIIVPPAVMLTCTGLAFSLAVKKTVTASSLNLGFAVFVWIGVPILLGLTAGVFDLDFEPWFESMVNYLVTLIPPVSAGITAAGLFDITRDGLSSIRFDLPTDDASFGGWIVICAINAAIQLGIGAAALALAFGRFNTINHRPS